MRSEASLASTAQINQFIAVASQPTPNLGSIFCKQPVEKFASGATVVWQGDAASATRQSS